ncbi:hypothetical protein VPH35_012688 [Triticum aestivum]
MDCSLAALKLLASQLASSTSSEGSSPAQMLLGIRFQRAWIQGVVVGADYSIGDGRLFVDDGSCGVTELMLRPEDAKGQPWRPGSPKPPSREVVVLSPHGTNAPEQQLPQMKSLLELYSRHSRGNAGEVQVLENFIY